MPCKIMALKSINFYNKEALLLKSKKKTAPLAVQFISKTHSYL